MTKPYIQYYLHIVYACFFLNFITTINLFAQDVSQQYDEISEFEDGWATVRQGDRWGVIDEQGNLMLPIQYKSIRVAGLNCDVMGLLIDGDYCFVDGADVRCYNQIKPFDERGRARAYHNGLHGFIDKTGKEILPVQYEYIDHFSDDGLATIRTEDDKFGIINKDLEFVISPIYKRIHFLKHTDYIQVWSDRREPCGLMDKQGQIILPIKYQSMRTVYGGDFIIAIIFHNHREWRQLFNVRTQQLLPTMYSKLRCLYRKGPNTTAPHFIAQKERKFGVIDEKGNTIIPFDYQKLEKAGKKLKAIKNGQTHFMDFQGNILKILKHGSVVPNRNHKIFSKSRSTFTISQKNGKYGVINNNYQTIVPFEYENIYKSGLQNAFIVNKIIDQQNRYALLDTMLNFIIPFDRNYQKIGLFGNDRSYIKKASIIKDGKYGIIDSTGREVIPPIYDNKIKIGDTLMSIVKNGKAGIIDHLGNEIIEPIYDQITIYPHRSEKPMFGVTRGDKQGIITYDENTVIPPNKYDRFEILNSLPKRSSTYNTEEGIFQSGYIIGIQGNKKVLINQQGEEIFEINYDYISTFDNYGLAIVNNGGKMLCMCITCSLESGKWGLINLNGEEVLPVEYEGIRKRKSKYVIFKNEQNSIYYPKNNEISPSYDAIYPFIQNIAMVKNGKKWGVIHKTQGEIISPQFDKVKYRGTSASDLASQMAKAVFVERHGKWGLINSTTGELVVPPKYSDIKFVDDEKFAYNIGKAIDICLEKEPENGLWGLLDLTGKELTPAKYVAINELRIDRFRVNIGGKIVRGARPERVVGGRWKIMDATGKLIE